jgi:hypothetical protein
MTTRALRLLLIAVAPACSHADRAHEIATASQHNTRCEMASDGSAASLHSSMASPFLQALHSESPAGSLGAAADVYAWLLGSWELEMIDHLPGGVRRESGGEVHFGWVLEGRAMQDVWISPRRHEREAVPRSDQRNTYGTTVRVYDPSILAWRVTWINPVGQVEDRMIGRRVGDRVVQEGRRADGSLIRWSFSDITAESFTWRGERSADGGATWIPEAEFYARRTGGR